MTKPSRVNQRSLLELATLVEAARRSPSQGDQIDGIQLANDLARRSQNCLNELVVQARADGVSWQAIGNALGVSRQGAFKRFGGAVDASKEKETMSQQTIDLIDRTHDVFESLNSDDYEAVKAHMTYTCARTLTKRKVMSVWNQVIAATGSLEACSDSTVQTPDGTNVVSKFANRLLMNGAVVQTTLRHEAGEWIGRVAYNGAGKITGLLIAPIGSKDLPF